MQSCIYFFFPKRVEGRTQPRTRVRGFCLWRIRVEVFIHPQVFHASAFSSLRSWRTQHDAKTMRCPGGGDHVGSPAGGRDRLGCGSYLPHVNAQPPEEGNTSYFWLLAAVFKGSWWTWWNRSVTFTKPVPYLQSQSRCKVYYCIRTRPAIHSLSLLQTSFIKPTLKLRTKVHCVLTQCILGSDEWTWVVLKTCTKR